MKKLNFYQFGRSMIEMLGVLAIVGVLSVGAIAGYQKAMMKYKLNKQAQQLSHLLNVLYRHKSSWGTNPPLINLVPYFKKLGEIPKEMIKGESSYIYDIVNASIGLHTNVCTNQKCTQARLSYHPNENNIEICKNIFTVAKSFHQNLYSTSAVKSTQDNPNPHSDNIYFYGDKYCDGENCIRNMSLEDIHNRCQYMKDKGTIGYYLFSFKISD